MSRLTIISLAVLLLLAFVNTDLATAKPFKRAKPFDAENVAARTLKQMDNSTDAAIAVIERIEELGSARIDMFYAADKEVLAQRFEKQIVIMITHASEMTIRRLEMLKNRTIDYLDRTGEYDLAAELEFQYEALVEKLIFETEESIAAITGEVAPETDPEIIDAE